MKAPQRAVALAPAFALALAVAFASFVGSAFVACGGKSAPPKEPMITETVADAGADAEPEPEAPKSLYERIGGQDTVVAVVESFTKNLSSHDATKKRFAKLSKERVERFKGLVVAQFCEATGGDCTYEGKDMKDAHKGMKISESEWNATVAALKAALEENKVGEAEQSDLFALLAPMKDDIVDPKAKK